MDCSAKDATDDAKSFEPGGAVNAPMASDSSKSNDNLASMLLTLTPIVETPNIDAEHGVVSRVPQQDHEVGAGTV